MKRPSTLLTRRDLIKQFGFAAFLLQPILRSMAYAASTSFTNAPRFVMFFKGAAFQPSQMPTSLDAMANTPLASLQAHKNDFILFKNMHIHGGSPKSSGYQEEHGAGLMGCVTGDTVHYTKSDSHYAYTKSESIDMRIAREYRARPELAGLPFQSLHVGGGAHSDADGVGLGQRFISYRAYQTGDSTYSNAVDPIQKAGTVYDALMERINLVCSGSSNQPSADQAKLRAALVRKKSVLDLKLKDIQDAKNKLGLDSEHARKLDGLLEGWRASESLVKAQLVALETGGSTGGTACPKLTRPTGDGTKKQDLGALTSVHDQMIGLTQLAFQWDLTRVVAFTLSGASCGQSYEARGVKSAHHSLEHSGDMAKLAIIDAYYAEKFANLLAALKGIDDGGGMNGLDNSSVVFGMECWSSTGHSLKGVPFMLAGKGGGKFSSGRIVDAGGRSNNDLLLSCLRASGINASTFGLANLCKGPIV